MLERELKIDRGQFLSDIITEIPTNTILNKTITGCGATTLEINASRDSIIIVPNVPVIVGKKAKHDFLFTVHEGISKEDVKAYLAGEHDGYRKIMTTPEGFDKKVLPAMYETGTPIYEDYFLLLDECEKTIQDVGYRGDIYLPVEDFFKFKGKAMVSATPIIPSDPRFEDQGFETLKITPTYDHRQPLTLIVTNNTVAVLRKSLELTAEKQAKVCIFINSTDTILGLIETLKLQGRCKVFCSETSVRKLKRQNFSDVSDKLGELADINFLTSRFYSAVDIELPYKPYVIILSDVIRAEFSMIDPHTEVVQAIGRFRNGITKVFHISNTYDRLQFQTQAELHHSLESAENIYNKVVAIPTSNGIEKEVLGQALNGMDYKRFVTRNGKRNYFMWDNAWEDERITSYYINEESLLDAYSTAPFILNKMIYKRPITDEDRLRRESKLITSKERCKDVVGQLSKLMTAIPNAEASYMLEELGEEFAVIIKAFILLGAKRMEELGYDLRKIERALGCVEENQMLTSEKMQDAVYKRFSTGDVVRVSEVNNFMHQLIKDNGIIFDGRIDRKVIGLFFEIGDCKIKEDRAFSFGKKKFEF